jgi:hypothetical protein
MGSNDFIMQKVYLFRLMPVCIGLKVVGKEKKGELRFFTVVGHKSGTVAIDVHFHFERAVCH